MSELDEGAAVCCLVYILPVCIKLLVLIIVVNHLVKVVHCNDAYKMQIVKKNVSAA